jgi:hypothetical protein
VATVAQALARPVTSHPGPPRGEAPGAQRALRLGVHRRHAAVLVRMPTRRAGRAGPLRRRSHGCGRRRGGRSRSG